MVAPIGYWLFDGRTHECLTYPNRQSMHHEHHHSPLQSTSSNKAVF